MVESDLDACGKVKRARLRGAQRANQPFKMGAFEIAGISPEIAVRPPQNLFRHSTMIAGKTCAIKPDPLG